MSVRETFHIELLGPEDGSAAEAVQHRTTVRTHDLDAATERALRVFARARTPQRAGPLAEAVRIVDGAGREVFRRSRFDQADD